MVRKPEGSQYGLQAPTIGHIVGKISWLILSYFILPYPSRRNSRNGSVKCLEINAIVSYQQEISGKTYPNLGFIKLRILYCSAQQSTSKLTQLLLYILQILCSNNLIIYSFILFIFSYYIYFFISSFSSVLNIFY